MLTALETGRSRHAGAAAAIASEVTSWSAARVADVERDLILDTLDHCLGNRTHAANILGISIRTLRNKLRNIARKASRVPMPGEPSARALRSTA